MTAQAFSIQNGAAIAPSRSLPSRSSSTREPWLRESVQRFFGDFNWEDSPPEVQQVKLSAFQASTAPLNRTLSVSQFFAAFNWDGATIGATPAAEPTPKAIAEVTVDDFFSQF